MLTRTYKFAGGILLLLLFAVAVHPQEWRPLTEKKRPTFFQLQTTVNQYYGKFKKDARKPGFKQFKRWEWFARTRLNKDGYVSPALHWQGWLEKQRRFAVVEGEWTPLGPVNVPAFAGSGPGLGRLNCIAFHPGNTDIIWVGAPTGGLWKSTDAGQTWSTNTDYLPNIGVSDILIHPLDPDIMYIATGDKERGSAHSIGVMKSTDGGQSWQLTGLNPDTAEKCKIGNMRLHPNNPDIILTATSHGIYKTIDGAATWAGKTDGDFYDIKVHPTKPSVWYASRTGFGVFRSLDSGEQWSRMTDGLPFPSGRVGRIVLDVSPASPGTVYAAYCNNIQGEGWVWSLYGIYRSTDDGATWSTRATGPNLLGWSQTGSDSEGQAGFAFVLAVNPADADVLYCGSVYLWKSMDGGATWDCMTYRETGDKVHVDHHDLVYQPGDSGVLFSCNDGGLFKTSDDWNTWDDLSSGLGIQQVYRLAVSNQDPGFMVAGAQDNGSEVLNGYWRSVLGGDGAGCMVDANDHSVFYCSWQFSNLMRFTMNGSQSRKIFYRPGSAWITPFIMDPHDPATLYSAGRQVERSTDRGDNWTVISGILSDAPMTVLSVAPSDSKCILTTDGRRLFKTIDGGDIWMELDTSLFPTFITDIAVHPRNRDVLWLTVGGFGRWNSRFTWENIPYQTDKPKVFRSGDGGMTWLDVSGQLPNIPANCLAIDPRSFNVYVGTDMGVFYSADGMGAWKRFDNGLPNVIVTDLAIHRAAGKLTAATYGRGVWQSPLAVSPADSPVYPPSFFTGRREVNRSFMQSEIVNVLNWNPNPHNMVNHVNITGYRLYRAPVDTGNPGENLTLLADLDAGEISLSGGYEYVDRRLETRDYKYALTAVDPDGNQSEPLFLTVRAADNN